MNVKSGFKVSELYIALIPIVINILVTLHVFSGNDSESIVKASELVVTSIVGLISGIVYIVNRTSLKKTALMSQAVSDVVTDNSKGVGEIKLQSETTIG